MSVLVLVGDDEYGIRQRIEVLKQSIDPEWRSINFQTFGAEDLACAIAAARSISFHGSRIVVIKDCGNFSQFSEAAWIELQKLDQIPPNHQLVFIGQSIDRRLKIAKYLLKQGTFSEHWMIPPWRTDLIVKAIAAQAKAIQIKLSQDSLEYLAVAIGNDQLRSQSELLKLKTYSNGIPITRSDVETLIPCTRQTSFQLAAAVRIGDIKTAIELIEPLLDQVEHPLIVIATLITQFRTWLWVKSTVLSGMTQNAEIAQVCEISNPNRIFFLRQEVAPLSLKALSTAMCLLVELEHQLKQGTLKPIASELIPKIIQIALIFPPS